MSGAIIHEWVAHSGGSEQVVSEFAKTFPHLPIWVLWSDDQLRFKDRQLVESWIARTPLRKSKPLALPWMLPTWRFLPKQGNDVDWMLVSSHLFAHHARFGPRSTAQKLVYAHTPARYIWAPDLDTRGASLTARTVSGAIKPLDRRRANEAVDIAANSEFTRRRIQQAWDRDAKVIYPPVPVRSLQEVDSWTDRLAPADEATIELTPTQYVLGASRFVSYKRLDIAIRAGEAAGLPVVIAGSGPEEARLRQIAREARVPVSFVIRPSNELLRALMQNAAALIFPAVEDFGIMPVEAMALGTPVVIAPEGGALESVQDGVSGAILDTLQRSSLAAAVERAMSCDRREIARRAVQFDSAKFREEIRAWVASQLKG